MAIFKEAQIRDVADVKGGKRLPKGKQLISTPNRHPYIRIRDLGKSKVLELNSDYEYVDPITQETIKKYIVSEGDILVSVVGTIGLVGIVGKSLDGANQTENCDKITNLRHIDRDYLYYYLISNLGQNEIEKGTVGAVQPKLPLKNVLDLKISYPEISVQRKIAHVLNRIDEKIAINNEINDNLLNQLKASFKHDYLEYTHNQAWKNVEFGSIVSKFATGLNPRKNFVLGHGTNYYVTIKNMGENRIYLDEKCDKVDDEALVKINARSDLKPGDFLFSGIGTIGRVYYIDKTPNNWNISESVFTIRPNNAVSSEFMYLLLLSDELQNYVQQHSQGSAQKGIRMADFKKFKLLLPNIEKMEELSNMWRPLINQSKLLDEENTRLASIRDSLLPKLMSGEIDVDSIEL